MELVFCNIVGRNVAKSQKKLLYEQAEKWLSANISNKALIFIDSSFWLILLALVKYVKGVWKSHDHKNKHEAEVTNVYDWALVNINIEWKLWTQTNPVKQ